MNSDHRRHRDFDQDNDRHEAHHSKSEKTQQLLEELLLQELLEQKHHVIKT